MLLFSPTLWFSVYFLILPFEKRRSVDSQIPGAIILLLLQGDRGCDVTKYKCSDDRCVGERCAVCHTAGSETHNLHASPCLYMFEWRISNKCYFISAQHKVDHAALCKSCKCEADLTNALLKFLSRNANVIIFFTLTFTETGIACNTADLQWVMGLFLLGLKAKLNSGSSSGPENLAGESRMQSLSITTIHHLLLSTSLSIASTEVQSWQQPGAVNVQHCMMY